MFCRSKLLFGFIIPFLIFFYVPLFCSQPLVKHKKDNSIIERKITRQATRFKNEIQLVTSVFFGLCAITVLLNGYNAIQFSKAFFSSQSDINISRSIFSMIFRGVFQLLQSAIATYVVHKGIQYGINYYFYKHPILWLLNRRVHIKDHFDSLFCKIANEQKKSPLCKAASNDVKNYILLFTKIILKDIQKVCAFMKYRALLLPSYKQPTVMLIQQNIISFVQEWIESIEEKIAHDSTCFDDLYQESLRFKKLFYEQIDLFVKIDDNKELIRDILTTIQPSLQ